MPSRPTMPPRTWTFPATLAFVALGASCAPSPPPAVPPPATTSTAIAATPQPSAAVASGGKLGDACSPEGATQNADACQKSDGMCAFSTCENGHWAWHEVPPRQNPPIVAPLAGSSSDLADGNKPFSIAMWIKPTKAGGTLAHVSSSADGTGWCTPFLGYDASGHIVSQVLHGSGPGASEFWVATSKAPPPGVWSHVAMTWAPGASNRLYVNGAEVAKVAAPTYRASGPGTRVIVTWGSSGTNGASACWSGAVVQGDFNGTVQGKTVVSTELTAAEVAALAKARP